MKKFSVGYINHDKEVFDKYLGVSLSQLQGEFDIITTTSEKCPAANYNEILDKCSTPYLILTHQDVTFPPNLLRCIEQTMEQLHYNFGALGMVGVSEHPNNSVIKVYEWSNSNEIKKIITADCCFIVVKNIDCLRFDDKNFDEFHCYVEDYCARMLKWGMQNYTILIDSSESRIDDIEKIKNTSSLDHHSHTLKQLGAAWGNYSKYRNKLDELYPGIKTT